MAENTKLQVVKKKIHSRPLTTFLMYKVGTEFKTNIKSKGNKSVIIKLQDYKSVQVIRKKNMYGYWQMSVSLRKKKPLFTTQPLWEELLWGSEWIIKWGRHLPFHHNLCPSPFSISLHFRLPPPTLHPSTQSTLSAISIGTRFTKAACNLPAPYEGLWMWSTLPRT